MFAPPVNELFQTVPDVVLAIKVQIDGMRRPRIAVQEKGLREVGDRARTVVVSRPVRRLPSRRIFLRDDGQHVVGISQGIEITIGRRTCNGAQQCSFFKYFYHECRVVPKPPARRAHPNGVRKNRQNW